MHFGFVENVEQDDFMAGCADGQTLQDGFRVGSAGR